jgi:cell fate regulator YaaT (PSP1 superfamily)
MPQFHYLRVGVLGHVGRFVSVDAVRYPRRARVIARTARGLEIGEVLSPPTGDEPFEADGELLRGMTVEDELLSARLEKNRLAAFAACAARIQDHALPATLMDVEHLFDGQTLAFYFLGEQPAALTGLLEELAEAYESQAQLRSFTDALTHGCGPGCGTEEATGGGCSSCSTGCAIAGACGTKKK